MEFLVKTSVTVPSIGEVTYEHKQHFDDDSNVFGRVVEYREHIRKTFPGCDFSVIEAKQIKEEK